MDERKGDANVVDNKQGSLTAHLSQNVRVINQSISQKMSSLMFQSG